MYNIYIYNSKFINSKFYIIKKMFDLKISFSVLILRAGITKDIST